MRGTALSDPVLELPGQADVSSRYLASMKLSRCPVVLVMILHVTAIARLFSEQSALVSRPSAVLLIFRVSRMLLG